MSPRTWPTTRAHARPAGEIVQGWLRSRALDNVWQRGVIAVLGAVGALIVGFIAWPVDQLLGRTGLIVWGVASLVVGGAGSAWARKGSREDAINIEGPR